MATIRELAYEAECNISAVNQGESGAGCYTEPIPIVATMYERTNARHAQDVAFAVHLFACIYDESGLITEQAYERAIEQITSASYGPRSFGLWLAADSDNIRFVSAALREHR